MNPDSNNKGKNELLINWSKWLISINVFATTGCIVGLKTAGPSIEKVGTYFFSAIVSFWLSIVCATLFVYLLSVPNPSNVEKSAQPFIFLARLQWILFMLGLIFVVIWIGFLSKIF